MLSKTEKSAEKPNKEKTNKNSKKRTMIENFWTKQKNAMITIMPPLINTI
mgnify:CR=1 FL=1